MPSLKFSVPPPRLNERAIRRLSSGPDGCLRSPLVVSPHRSNARYHARFPVTAEGVDLVLSSSDHILFAVNRDRLFCHSDAFRSVGLEAVAPGTDLPLVVLGEPHEVVEIMLRCLDPDELPDLSSLDFRTLVAALEAAADKYRLLHTEKICLLGLGAFFKTRPIEVFSLANAYDCGWLARAASEHTLGKNLDSPQWHDVLTPDAYERLRELHYHRAETIRSLAAADPGFRPHPLHTLPPPTAAATATPTAAAARGPTCDGAEALRFWRSCAGRLRAQAAPDLDLPGLVAEEQAAALGKMNCRGCIALMLDAGDKLRCSFQRIRRTVL